jgi:HEAT repeat protein
MSQVRWNVIAFIVLTAFSPAAGASDPDADRKRLQDALGGVDAERVIAYLQTQHMTEAARQQLSALIEQMGDRQFRKREEASRKLVEAGPVALPLLRRAIEHSDREISTRAKRALADIEASPRRDLPLVAIRHLVRLRHERAVEVMFQFLTIVEDESTEREIIDGLATIGVSNTAVHPLIQKAITDPAPERRAVAAQLLSGSKDPACQKQLRSALTDSDSRVRFHVAMHLLSKSERAAVPTLIDIVKDGVHPMHWQQAEEALYELGGDIAPRIEIGEGGPDERKQAAEQWKKWWQDKGEQVLLGRKDERVTDIAVVCDTDGKVFEWKPDGKSAFEITDVAQPVDAHWLPGNRILIADQNGHVVTERSYDGKVLWKKVCADGPVTIQRLSNGNTFIATMTRVTEVRRDGAELYSYPIDPNDSISDANRMPDGRIAICCFNGQLIILAPNGKSLLKKNLGGRGAVEALPNGRLLITQVGASKVTEMDAEGKVHWEVNVNGLWFGTRLPDGGTLIALKQAKKMVKVDANGKTVWEKEINGEPHAIHWK